MGRILIKKVVYRGDKFEFESPELNGGINIVEGKNGNGKSTFMNLIYYGLSGKVDEFQKSNRETHDEIVNDTNNFVRLDLLLNSKPFSLIRYIDSNDITVLPDENNAKVYPIFRSKNEKEIFSDWILNELGIETVEVFQGTYNSKVNFKDLLRLIYYNQELNPKRIYKPADADNFISDSELIRKIIFELLVGKTYSQYYIAVTKLKEKEKEKNIAKGILDDFITGNKPVTKGDDLNLVFLKKVQEEKEDQLNKLTIYRQGLRDQAKPKSRFYTQINEIKLQILSAELELGGKARSYSEVTEELSKLRRIRESVILEVTQITKIIHSHEKLSLFSADTCPYCLREVNREKGHCVCGSEIEEEQYERFFYSSEEYTDILKSKQKSIETIEIAIAGCQEQVAEVGKEIDDLNSKIEEYNNQITDWISEYDFTSNSQELKQADDLMLSVRTELQQIGQQIQIEQRREQLHNQFVALNNSFETIRDQVKILEIQSKSDMKAKIEDFNKIYNDLMISTLESCRSAAISFDDYMPIIDDGVYKEASASVPIRMMYFFTLLKLSLDNEDVSYPRFLMIDTPETAGVDADALMRALLKIQTISANHDPSEYQIILTTGINKYPEEFSDNVRVKLSNESKLLRPISQTETTA